MAFVELPDPARATGRVREVFDATAARWGYVPNIVRALALRPDVLEAEDAWSRAVMYEGTLPRALKEAVATTVSVVNGSQYCATSHAYQAGRVDAADATLDACRRLDFGGLPEAERVALEFARKAARDMNAIGPADVSALRKHYAPEQVVELAAVIGSFMMYNTFVTVLGLELEPGRQRFLP